MLRKTAQRLERRLFSLPLHHIDTSVFLEPENTENGRYCKRYLQKVGYKYKGKLYHEFPASIEILTNCEPVYENIPGWKETTHGIRRFTKLPREAQNYIHRIQALVGAEISLISMGRSREETIMINPKVF